MKFMPALIDLHCHSTVSDGVLTPEELVSYAAKQGVKVLGLTDHDDLGGLAIARRAAEQHGIGFIDGVEISATWKRQTLHIVGLKINPNDEALKTALGDVRIGRDERAQQIGDDLARVGVENAYEGAKAIANGSIITRSHFATFLVDNGYVSSVKSAFKRYLVKGKPGFIDHQWMSLEQAVNLIVGSGGVAVVAHPGRYDLGFINLHLLMHEFKTYGGEAIEVVTGSHQPPQYQHFAKIAKRFSFKASQGSDYHGPGRSYLEMGRLPDLPRGLVPVWRDWAESEFLH
jgi:3',5'-nucleoside bisphosphate phosphatase